MYLDLHCDTIWKFIDHEQHRDLKNNPFSVNLEKMKQGECMLQCFACFVASARVEDPFGYYQVMRKLMKAEEEKYKDCFRLVTTAKEAEERQAQGLFSGLLTVEDGGILEGKMERLDQLYDDGIRLITLLWNDDNCIGHTHSADPEHMAMGLKPFGFEVVEQMNEKKMIIDVSHMSDGGFWDVIKHSKSPILASHSNARAVCGHTRNMTDDMIRALANKGGIMGINFFDRFLREKNEDLLEAMVVHMEYIRNIGGIDMLAIGTDFDGFSGPCPISGCDEMELLWNQMRKHGFHESEIEKIQYKNGLRFMKDVLGE